MGILGGETREILKLTNSQFPIPFAEHGEQREAKQQTTNNKQQTTNNA
ncbi:MAG: hypothetical protein F6J96_01405 [Symploca sp. SIO1C2]|nr:hypothetical protein [Symploca sp. SIO1C2]